MNSLFKNVKSNYTQIFTFILPLCASEYIFPIFDRYLLIQLQEKISCKKLKIQRIYPGNQGGTHTKNNIRIVSQY